MRPGRIDPELLPSLSATPDLIVNVLTNASVWPSSALETTAHYAQLMEGLFPRRANSHRLKSSSPFRNFDLASGSNLGGRRSTEPTLLTANTTRVNITGLSFAQDSHVQSPIIRSPSGTDLTPRTSGSQRITSGSRPALEHTRYLPSVLLRLPDTSDISDTETNMRTMDKLYNATFYEFIRSEDNIMTIARHLLATLKDYDLKTIATGLRWTMNGWKLESVAKLMKLVTRDWLPDICGILVNLVTIGWITEEYAGEGSLNKTTVIMFQESLQISLLHMMDTEAQSKRPALAARSAHNACLKLVAIMIAGETPEIAATFIKALTSTDNWTENKVTELVSFLDAVLEWDERYFRDFTRCYIELSVEDKNPVESVEATINSDEKIRPKSGKLSFNYLATLYKTNLALANYKLALADFKLALASRGLPSSLGRAGSTSAEGSAMNPLALLQAALNDNPTSPSLRELLAEASSHESTDKENEDPSIVGDISNEPLMASLEPSPNSDSGLLMEWLQSEETEWPESTGGREQPVATAEDSIRVNWILGQPSEESLGNRGAGDISAHRSRFWRNDQITVGDQDSEESSLAEDSSDEDIEANEISESF